MKQRICSLAVTAATVAASVVLTAPSATASEAAQLAPSGSALIRLDGERAVAKQASDGRYFIVMPAGAEAGWIGPAAGVEGVSSGRFGARTLVASWADLGHRGKTGVLTTLTWTTSNGKESALARVSDPRMNADGRLVFTARSPKPLPRVMQDFSVNISGAPEVQATTRSTTYPFVGNAIGIPGSTVSINATATSINSANYVVSGTDCPAGSTAQWTRTLAPNTYAATFSGNICGVTFTTSDGTPNGAASDVTLFPKVKPSGYSEADTEFWIMTTTIDPTTGKSTTAVSSTFDWTFMYWS